MAVSEAHVMPWHGNRCWYCAMLFVRKMLLISSNLDAQACWQWRIIRIMQIPLSNNSKLTYSTKELNILLGCVHSQCLWPTRLQKSVCTTGYHRTLQSQSLSYGALSHASGMLCTLRRAASCVLLQGMKHGLITQYLQPNNHSWCRKPKA